MKSIDDLFSTLDNLQLEADDEIAPEDRAYCERLQEQFENVKTMLAKIRHHHDAILAVTEVEGENEANPWRSVFSALNYEVEKASKLLDGGGRERFVHKIRDYFAKTYSINAISKSDYHSLFNKPDLHWRDVLKLILAEVGSIGLRDAGKQQIISDFRALCVRHHSRSPQMIARLSNDGLKLGDVYLYSSWKYQGLSIDYDNKSLNVILHALQYFETGELDFDLNYAGLRNLLLQLTGNNLIRSHEIDGDKIASLRFYRNNRVDIRFQSEAHREEFVRLFRLEQLLIEQESLKLRK